MTNLGTIYCGSDPYKVDAKFRVSVPPAWRDADDSAVYLVFLNENKIPLIKVFPAKAFASHIQYIKDCDLMPSEKMRYLEALSTNCVLASINDQGKLSIPKSLSLKAGIDAESQVQLTGKFHHYVIMNADFHETLNQKLQDELEYFEAKIKEASFK